MLSRWNCGAESSGRNSNASWLLVLTALLVISTVTPGFGQQRWEHTYGSPNYDHGNSVWVTSGGGYMLAGSSGDGAYLVKTDGSGDTTWSRIYHNPGCYAEAFSIQQTRDGGYIVAGIADTLLTGLGKIYLLKTNAQGDSQWSHWYINSAEDEARSVRQTPDNGFIVAGSTSASGRWDCYLIKTDSNGSITWARTYGGAESIDDMAKAVALTSDGGYLVVGWTQSGNNGGYVFKTDASGDTVWSRVFGGATLASVETTAGGGCIVAGSTGSHIFLAKLSASGDSTWAHVYGMTSSDVGNSVTPTFDGGYVIAGGSTPENWMSACLMKTDAQGDSLWTRLFPGDSMAEAWAVRQAVDSGYIIAGTTFSQTSYEDAFLIKTDAQGLAAVVERPRDYPVTSVRGATLVRGLLRLPAATGLRFRALSSLLDINGREVLDLHAGANDISHLAPGVYFVRSADGGARSAVGKVVIAR